MTYKNVLEILEAKRDCWKRKLDGCTCNDSCDLSYAQGRCGEQPEIYDTAIECVRKMTETTSFVEIDKKCLIHGIVCYPPNFICSRCRKFYFHNEEMKKYYKFCPNCGLRVMREVSHETK